MQLIGLIHDMGKVCSLPSIARRFLRFCMCGCRFVLQHSRASGRDCGMVLVLRRYHSLYRLRPPSSFGSQIMFKWGKPEEGQSGRADGPQYCLGGDTWVIGCRIPDCTVCTYHAWQHVSLRVGTSDASFHSFGASIQP